MKYNKEYYNAYSNIVNKKSLNFIDNSTIRAEKLLKTNFDDWSLILFLDSTKIFEALKNVEDIGIICIISVIKRWLMYKKHKEHRIYAEYSNKINELYKHRNINRIAKYKDNTKTVDLDILRNNFINNFENIKKMKYIKLRNHLILGFYIFMPPVRLGNLEYMKYIKNPTRLLKHEDTKYNYISKIEGVYNITYNQFKTVKFLKQQTFKIENKYLIDLLDIYFSTFKNELENTESNYLLYQGYNFEKKIDNVSIGASIPKLTYTYTNIKSIHINDIRTSYFKNFYSQNPTIDEERDLSYKMGILYSPETKLLYT
mgnify:CR=1 FL=1